MLHSGGLERVARDKHSSLLRKSVNYSRNKFYSTDTRRNGQLTISQLAKSQPMPFCQFISNLLLLDTYIIVIIYQFNISSLILL